MNVSPQTRQALEQLDSKELLEWADAYSDGKLSEVARMDISQRTLQDMAEACREIVALRMVPKVSLKRVCMTPGCESRIVARYLGGVFLLPVVYGFSSCPSHRAECADMLGVEWIAPRGEFLAKCGTPRIRNMVVRGGFSRTGEETFEEEYAAWSEAKFDPDMYYNQSERKL